MIKYHIDKMEIRELTWSNISKNQYLSKNYNSNSDFVSVCHWMG